MIRLGLVGKGRWGKNYIRAVREIASCELPEDTIKTRNYQDLFHRKDIDGVIIATPASTHFSIAKEFIEKGFPVLIEKPMTVSGKEALQIKKIQQKSKTVVMVGHIYQYNPAFRVLREALSKIGKIKYMYGEGLNYGPFTDDISVLWDRAVHYIIMCYSLIGAYPLQVSCWGLHPTKNINKAYDDNFLQLFFPGNIKAFIRISTLSPVKKSSLTVFGERKTIVFDDTSSNKLVVFKKGNQNKNFLPFPNIEPLRAEINEFVDCIKNHKEPETGVDQGILTAKIIEAAELSLSRRGKFIRVN